MGIAMFVGGVWALGAIGDRQAVPPLIQALGDGNSDVRAAACRALGQIGDPQALPHLIQALEDEDEDVRWAAREAVEQIKAKQFARNNP
jgi:HEAT repeat protein